MGITTRILNRSDWLDAEGRVGLTLEQLQRHTEHAFAPLANATVWNVQLFHSFWISARNAAKLALSSIEPADSRLVVFALPPDNRVDSNCMKS